MLANPAEFFHVTRIQLFAGTITQAQVEGTNALLSVWDGHDPRWTAYGLATAYHETDYTMQPIPEYGHGRGYPYGRTDPQTGQAYYGRGYVQLTWRQNYARADAEIPGFDLVHHPDNALKPEVAAVIMLRGMTEGWFTGLTLDHYMPLANPARADWVGARRIINGTDCAAQIALYAQKFAAALKVGGYSAAPGHAAAA